MCFSTLNNQMNQSNNDVGLSFVIAQRRIKFTKKTAAEKQQPQAFVTVVRHF